MTQYEFFNAVANANVNAELAQYAQEAMAKADAAKEARKAKPSKARVENEGLVPSFMEVLSSTAQTIAEIASAMDITASKATAVAKVAIEMGNAITVGEGKGKSGKVKTYALASEA